MSKIKAVTFDCRNAAALARFWADVLDGYDVRPYDDAEIARLADLGLTPETDTNVAVDGPGPTLFFQKVREGKVVKNRVHLDVTPDDRAAEVQRLVALGARVYAEHEGNTVMLDPEGNEFCIEEA